MSGTMDQRNAKQRAERSGDTLYHPSFEHDSCGFGLISHLEDQASHQLVRTAVTSLERMTHRGAVAADQKSGDGCGLLLKYPTEFLRAVAAEARIDLAEDIAVGVVFLSPDAADAQTARVSLARELEAEGLATAGWRRVPTDPSACGAQSRKSLPEIEQIFVNMPPGMHREDLHRRLYFARRRAEKSVSDPYFYVASLSAHVISYKALVLPANLTTFYPDLADPRLASSVCVFHQRFSTNTWPQWRLAQPFRYLAHNGEINTIRGNRRWAKARAAKFSSPLIPNVKDILPIVSHDDSDSASLDNMLEMLLAGGLDVFQAMRVLIPPAWQNVDDMDPELRAFYQYYALNTDPWDGPGGIVLTDGRYAACVLDRNGLRPARYVVTKDKHITLASEIGVYDYDPSDVVSKGRLGPGQMLAVDTANGKILLPDDIDEMLKTRAPYKRWLKEQVRYLEPVLRNPQLVAEPPSADRITYLQKLFGVTFEERDQVLRVMAEAGHEAVGSMGDDTPMPVLSRQVRSLYDYFRQQFAQVTNPPIDPLRESLVMSLETNFGVETNLFEASVRQAKRLVIESPLLSQSKYEALLLENDPAYQHQIIQLAYQPESDLKTAVASLCTEAERLVRQGARILVLNDEPRDSEQIPMHALLATGAVHHHLVEAGLRCDCNIVVATGTARDAHHVACLLGFGATAVYPYLAYYALHDMVRNGELFVEEEEVGQLGRNYRKGINKGLYKILSKMGISTMWSYRGSQLFEIIGLHDEVVSLCFSGAVSRIQGAKFADLESDQRALLKFAKARRKPISQGGLLKYVHDGEYHAYHPDVIQSLQDAVRTGDITGYRRFAGLVNERPVAVLRDLLEFVPTDPIDINDVESVEDILPRFESAGMSLGALSPEAHEALAQAMNRIGGRSNSGEGGEDPKRYGTDKRSKIKQVASGRFGVTPHYLVNAEVLQIKVAQGAKPGEGGQLPGHKVNRMIASLRFAKPGIGLISPPPHHDIYSIEDLAQLIFDLKQVNPEALVSVKLVAEPGVGTIAAGVAKAYADLITISGYDGGTGASPLTSVKYAGCPWELGLAETHQTLRQNDLRGRVRLQTDGGLKTGKDVIKAAILGAESFGFGTAPMVALGCKYLRICHLNNCATGVATQNEALRKNHFVGLPEMVVNYFRFVAQETRELLAELGVKNLADLIGRTDLLRETEGQTDRQRSLDLSPILSDGDLAADQPQYCVAPRNEPFDKAQLAEQMVADLLPAIENLEGGEFSYRVQNFNRSIGARLSGEIARRHGDDGMAANPITLKLEGSAGQSLGAWNAGGLQIDLVGDANDYVGKGMAGGRITLTPPLGSAFEARETPIMGNTCLYGATGGQLFACGTAGERFAVRNSGASAVVEGVGDHGCEYMTGGIVVVLGRTGRNFGAGMTGGFAYVLDSERDFVDRYNHELIDIHRISTEPMEAHVYYLRALIQDHVALTGSRWGQEILEDLRDFIGKFWLVKPKAADIDGLLDILRRAA